jgi:thioredoxin 1
MVLSVNDRTFNQEVLQSPVPVLVNFEAPWCGLCRIIHPLLLQFQAQCSGEIKLVRVNADDNFKLANTYRLKSLPTLILVDNGVVKQRLEGFSGRDDLNSALAEIRDSYINIKNIKVAKTYSPSETTSVGK